MSGKMEHFTQRARRVLALAQGQAALLQHRFILPEHLLLGLILEDEGTASRVLREEGLEIEQVRKQVVKLTWARPSQDKVADDLPASTKRILELSVDEARRMGHYQISTAHLLLGLLRYTHNSVLEVFLIIPGMNKWLKLPSHADLVALQVLKSLGTEPKALYQRTLQIVRENPQSVDLPLENEKDKRVCNFSIVGKTDNHKIEINVPVEKLRDELRQLLDFLDQRDDTGILDLMGTNYTVQIKFQADKEI